MEKKIEKNEKVSGIAENKREIPALKMKRDIAKRKVIKK